jgi:hypothetical protein
VPLSNQTSKISISLEYFLPSLYFDVKKYSAGFSYQTSVVSFSNI